MSVTQWPVTAQEYDAAAREYYQTLPMEHFMEARPQATQRELALASFALLKTRRRGVEYFSELLVQYWFDEKLRRVVPDNMLVISDEPVRARSCYAMELEPARPFMMLEWVSDSSEGKDYGETFRKYEQELRTPYCLCFHPDQRKWEVFRHDGQRYEQLEPDLNGRVEIPELDLQIGLHQGWIRFWYQGELLEIPAELGARIDHLSSENVRQSEQLERQSEQLQQQSEQLERKSQRIVQLLRRCVEEGAKKAGRQDILAELLSADSEQLERWLQEL